MNLIQGADLSTYQRNIDYAQLAQSIGFAYVKCSDASMRIAGVWTPFEDDMHRTHVLALRAAGVPTGDYAFGHPSMDPIAHCDFFIAHAWYDQLRPVIDMEALSAGHTPENAGPWCLAWLRRFASRTGVQALRYSSPYYDDAMVRAAPDLAPLDLWEAAYPEIATPPDYMPARPRVLLWQWTGSSRLPGVPGPVDRDVCPDLGPLRVPGATSSA